MTTRAHEPQNLHPSLFPAILIGLLLFGACLFGAWYINRLQRNLATILSRNVAELERAQELEIRARQLRLFRIPHRTVTERLKSVAEDERGFEDVLRRSKDNVAVPPAGGGSRHVRPEEEGRLGAIEQGYRQYQADLARLRGQVARKGPITDFPSLAAAHPVRHVVEPCREWLIRNEAAMRRSAAQTERVAQRARLAMPFLGVLGPAGGLIAGYGMARGLSRSIYRLIVRDCLARVYTVSDHGFRGSRSR